MTGYPCALCPTPISTADDLITVNVDGHGKAAHRTCPPPPEPNKPGPVSRRETVARDLLRHYASEYQADHLSWTDFAADADQILAALDEQELADAESPDGRGGPAREYVVTDYDQTVYVGQDLTAALAAWDASAFPDCFVNETVTRPVELRPARD